MSGPNYVEGVPVKISERFKPPPKIILPSSVAQKLSSLSNVDISHNNVDYDFNLEQNVLTKIEEWKNVRQKENDVRQERKRLREQARIKQIEDEQKQKLNDVSYPSTDDLSSSEDEQIAEDKAVAADSSNKFHQPHQIDSILMPTIVPGLDNRNISYALPSATTSTNSYYSNQPIMSKINFADFENDTSSPFDNMELKTINDLDILAQVLNTTVKLDENIDNNTYNNIENNNKEEIIQSTTAAVVIPAATSDQQNSNLNYYNHQQYNNYNNFNSPNQYALTYNDMQNYTHSNSTLYQNSPQMVSAMGNYHNSNYYINHNYANNYGYSANIENSFTPSIDTVTAVYSNEQTYEQQQQQKKIKSKSVPDIMKELNADVKDSEMRRIRNNSQTIAEQSKVEEEKNSNVDNKLNKNISDSSTYDNLSKSSQTLVKSISSMGFSKDLVSRITQKLGNDDKKIIEHLIPLSELLVLGFDENRISDALIKFDNDKEKALDFLIS